MFTEHNLDIVNCILYAKATSGEDQLFTFILTLDNHFKKIKEHLDIALL